MRLVIRHVTAYRYSNAVARGLQRVRLTPKGTSGQKVVSWTMEAEGAVLQADYDDHNHNRVSLLAAEPGVDRVTIRCEGVVDTADNAGIIGRHAGFLPLWHFQGQTPLTAPGPALSELVDALPREDDAVPMLHRLSAAIRERVPYGTGQTDAETSAEGAVVAGTGVCQDHAHIFIGAARALGFPARYISGYLMMNDRVEQEATHAWAEAHVDGLGWVGFDVSNGICPDQRYVRVATGRDYGDAAPVTGISYGAGDEAMHVRLAVEQQQVAQ